MNKDKRLIKSAVVLAKSGIVPFSLWWCDLPESDREVLRGKFGIRVYQEIVSPSSPKGRGLKIRK